LRIPEDVLGQFKEAIEGVESGAVALTAHFNRKGGKPRFTINRLPGNRHNETSGTASQTRPGRRKHESGLPPGRHNDRYDRT